MPGRLIDNFLLTATVASAQRLTGRMHAITLAGQALADLTVLPGQQVRIQVGSPNALVDRLVGALRTYSIWDYGDDRLELRIFDHGEGPGAEWARNAKPGDQVQVGKPQGTFVTRNSPYHLFVGDETASAAFGPMIRNLGQGSEVYSVVEADTEAERLPIPDAVWVMRNGRPATRSAELVAVVAQLNLPRDPRNCVPRRRGGHHPDGAQPPRERQRLEPTRHPHQALLGSRQDRPRMTKGATTRASQGTPTRRRGVKRPPTGQRVPPIRRSRTSAQDHQPSGLEPAKQNPRAWGWISQHVRGPQPVRHQEMIGAPVPVIAMWVEAAED